MSQLPSAQELLAALQQSTRVIQSLENRLNRYHEPIAIIGIGCRFPGRPGAPAHTPEAYWENLRNGADAVSEVIGERWPIEEYYDPDPAKAGKTYTRYGAFIDQVDQFDPRFFGLSPRETIKLDPQHRLLLETAWEAIEHAGIAADRLRNTPVGVFVGLWTGEYGKPLISAMDDFYSIIGNVTSTAAGRLSYLLGLTGPALAVDTACSASLVSIHLACQSLRHGECKMALAGGVNLILAPEVTALFCRGSLLAPDGRCKTFDAAANGYVRGEGCGMILLKPLTDALADNDPIIAVIRGTAINQDGPSSGLTVPNGPSQEGVIRQALKNARVKPEDVSYVEAHGTGTALGDPIEIGALTAVFQGRTTPLHVGSVKTNFGHLEFAAGIAGVIKVALALQHGEIPKHLHFDRPNPLIDWDQTPIQIPTETIPWTVPAGKKRLAGVSSFGFSGTNAHVVLEEAPAAANAATRTQPTVSYQLLTLSAKDEPALHALARRYADAVAALPANEQSAADLADLCYTAQCGRNHYPHRLSVTAPDAAQMQAQLTAYAQNAGQQIEAGMAYGYAPKGQKAKVAFLFTGQGAQYVNMGRDLYATQPIFRGILDRCNAIWQTLMGRSLLDLLYPTGAPEHNDLLESHPCGQAANFALECALADLWRAWGIEPAVVLGHSLGDFAAAYTAGVLTLEDGLRLVTERGRLMEKAAGTMLSVIGSEAEVMPFLVGLPDVTIGVINGPRSVVISGGHASMAQVTQQLQAAGFKTRKLDIPVAAHSPMLDPVLDAFETAVRKITLAPPKVPVVSSMTGQLVTHELTDPRYWRRHLRNTVRFADGVQTLHAQGCTLFLEIGPKPTLLGMTQAIFDFGFGILDSPVGEAVLSTLNPKSKIPNSVLLPSLREDRPAWQQMLESLGELYVHGVEVDWGGFHNAVSGAGTRRRVALPTYPFQRQRYWDELFKPQRPSAPSLRPLINKMTQSPAIKETIFETEFSLAALPFLADHLVYDAVVSPGACQLALLLSAAELTFGAQQPLQVADVILPQALVVPREGMRTVQAVLTPAAVNGSGPKYEFHLISFDPGSLQGAATVETATHATGYLTLPATHPATVDLDALRQTYSQPVDVAAHDEDAAAMQLQLGPSFRWIAELWQGSSDAGYTALGKLYLPDAISNTTGYLLHPGLLDACFQVASVAQAADARQGETWLPFAVAGLRLYQPMTGDQWWCHVTQVDSRKWDIQLLDTQGQVVVAIDGYEVRAAPPAAVRTGDAWRDWLYEVAWQPRPYFGLAPDYLPTPAQVAQTLQVTLPTLWADHGGAQQQRFFTALEDLSVDYVLTALAKAGFLFQPGAQWRTEQIAQKIGVIPHYRRLLARLLAILAEVNILAATDDGWQVVQTPAPANPQAKVAALQATYGNTPELTLLTRCGEKLSEVLRGLQEPLELLFPGGDTSDANRFYTESSTAKVMNTLVQQVVEQAVQKLPDGRGLRIVEIGAGTGGTTVGLLPYLPAAQTDYLFTDISSAFLTKAQERFADYAFVRYQPLDIEQAPATQGFARHQVDLVIAANVLHATKDLAETLSHVRQLLQPGGQLVLMEGSRRSRLIDLTFGLTDGWWRFADTRTDHPLLTAAQWRTLLLEQGFQAVETVEESGQMVIVASTGSATAPFGEAPDELAATVAVAGSATTQRWLIFADAQGIGETLTATLQARGETPLLVYAGHAYQQTGERRFTIRPDSAEDHQQLLAAVSQSNDADYQVVHLWSLDTPTLATSPDLLTIAQQSSGHVLTLVQALLQQAALPSGLWLVTQEAQAATATDSVTGAASAGVWGMGKVIALEHPELRCVCVDLAQPPDQATLAAQLAAEITADFAQERQEDQVALRLAARYVARLLPYQAPTPATMPKLTMHADGTYLITGGLGGLGLAVARWLAEQGARHLLLIGRSQPKAEAQTHLTALTAMGVTVTVAQADVTDQAALATALQKIDERYPLRGVIHAVGVLDDGVLVQQSWSRFARVLAPKVQGAWHLHTLTQERPLDFFVLFSSAASLLGNRGQANHAAANAILDAFVHYRRAQGLPALSINWGPWAEIGAAAELMRSHQPALAAQGISAIAPQQGIQAFAYLLTQASAQVGVVSLTWAKYLSSTKSAGAYYSAFVQSAAAPVVAVAAQPIHLRQQLATATAAERNHLLFQYLRTAIAKVLRLPTPEQIDLRQGIMEMGMDSLMAVELRNHLGRTLEHPLPSTLIFDYPTLELLHGYLVSELFGTEQEEEQEEEPQQTEAAPANDAGADDLSDDDIAALLAQAVYAQ